MAKLWTLSKKLLTSVSGLCILMVLATVLIASMGTLLSGGLQQWQTALKNASPYLLIWRVIIYTGLAVVWYSTLKLHKQKANEEGLVRTKKLGGIALLVIICVEGSKLWGVLHDYQ